MSEDLKNKAIQIRNEKGEAKNTAERVGNWMESAAKELDSKASKNELANVTTNYKGLFSTEDALIDAFPRGNQKDWFAFVGTKNPREKYAVIETGGLWIRTYEKHDVGDANLDEYVSKDGLLQEVGDEKENAPSSFAVNIVKNNTYTSLDIQESEIKLSASHITNIGISSTTGAISPNDTRLGTPDIQTLPVGQYTIVLNNEFDCKIEQYDAKGGFLKSSWWLETSTYKTISENVRFGFRKKDNSIITLSEFDNIGFILKGFIFGSGTLKDFNDAINKDILDLSNDITRSGLSSVTGEVTTSENRLSTPIIIKLAKKTYDVSINSGFDFRVAEYDAKGAFVRATDWLDKATVNFTNQYNNVRFCFRRKSDAKITVEDFASVGFIFKNYPYAVGILQNIGGSAGNESAPSVVSRNIDVDAYVDASVCVNNEARATDSNRFSFLHFSDLHGDKERFTNILEYLNYKSSLDLLLTTGDIQTLNVTSDSTWFYDACLAQNKPVLLTVGNHDVGNSKTTTDSGTTKQVYDKFIAPLKKHSNLVTDSKCYWHYDNEKYKIRVIASYEYDNDDKVGDSFRIKRGDRVLSQAQINWIIQTLLSTPKDYAVIFMLHQNPALSLNDVDIDIAWNEVTDYRVQNVMSGYFFNDIVDAWQKGIAINKTYSFIGDGAYLPVVNAVADFSTRGKGEFITFLHGHIHNDFTGTYKNYPNQHFIGITCASNKDINTYRDKLGRNTKGKNQDAFNVVSISREKRKVFITRVGANVDKYFKERKIYVFDY